MGAASRYTQAILAFHHTYLSGRCFVWPACSLLRRDLCQDCGLTDDISPLLCPCHTLSRINQLHVLFCCVAINIVFDIACCYVLLFGLDWMNTSSRACLPACHVVMSRAVEEREHKRRKTTGEVCQGPCLKISGDVLCLT